MKTRKYNDYRDWLFLRQGAKVQFKLLGKWVNAQIVKLGEWHEIAEIKLEDERIFHVLYVDLYPA